MDLQILTSNMMLQGIVDVWSIVELADQYALFDAEKVLGLVTNFSLDLTTGMCGKYQLLDPNCDIYDQKPI